MFSAENVATPAIALALEVPASVPPLGLALSATLTTPVKLDTGSPSVSRAVTTMAIGVPEPIELPAAGPLDRDRRVAGNSVPVAENDTGEPDRPAAVAVAVCDSAVSPSVHDVCAAPFASVVAVAGFTEPPLAAANVTGTPATPSPSAAVTRTTSGWASVRGVGFPTMPVCPLPETAAMALATGLTVSVAVSAAPLMSRATMRAVPRTPSAVPVPAVGDASVARVGSRTEKAIGVLATVAPAASSPTAEKLNGAPVLTDRVRGAMRTVRALDPGPVYTTGTVTGGGGGAPATVGTTTTAMGPPVNTTWPAAVR